MRDSTTQFSYSHKVRITHIYIYICANAFVYLLTLMFVSELNQRRRQIPPPEEAHDFGFHISTCSLSEAKRGEKKTKDLRNM